jgi:hypothetical protein
MLGVFSVEKTIRADTITLGVKAGLKNGFNPVES